MSKRSRFEISADILKVAEGGVLKYQIVYKANLNNGLADRYVKTLLEKGLLEKTTKGKRLFTTTEIGLNYLESFEGLQSYIS